MQKQGGDRAEIKRFHLRQANPAIGATGDDDLILAAPIHRHHGGAGGARAGDEAADVDPGRGQGLARGGGEDVIANRADHRHRGPGAGGGDRLVGALAAGVNGVVRT